MNQELIPLDAAGDVLGVTAERVRQLVIAGDLPGMRFGNAWAVPRASVTARASSTRRRGRPLGARRTWQSINVGEVDLEDVGRFRNRGAVHRYDISRADLDYLIHRDAVLFSGVGAAIQSGELLTDSGANAAIYMPEAIHARLHLEVALVADPLGGLVVRTVPDTLWDLACARAVPMDGTELLAPPAAVALDLMESSDPRHWIAAQRLITDHA